jgi:exopolysaccharide production protein ExoY
MEFTKFTAEGALGAGVRDGASPAAWSSRIVDISVALLALFFFLPLMFLIAAVVRLESPGPIIYRHPRIGKGGRLFQCLKFRTMLVNGDQLLEDLLSTCPTSRAEWERDFKLRVDPRVTRVGRVLRKLSLDELPQLVNVLRGEMSIVGPRPIVAAEVSRYGQFFTYYCAVTPGITGLWQISGRNDICYAERVQLDVEYARFKSLKNDIAIILKTIPAVVFARGSY